VSRKKAILTGIVVLCVLQFWLLYIPFKHNYLGINLELKNEHKWVIKSLDRAQPPNTFQIGDIIHKIDGEDPENHHTVIKWRALEQAKSIEIIRDSQYYTYSTTDFKELANNQVLSFIAELISLTIAGILLKQIPNSKSSLHLALLFVTIALTFMALNSSIRGDATGKFVISSALSLVPIVFLHFIIVFFNEKTELKLPSKTVKILYAAVGANAMIRITFYYNDSITYFLYQYSTPVTLAIFTVSCLIIFVLLSKLFFKYRTSRSYAAIMIKSVWTAMFVSFTPILFISFLPRLITGREWISSLYTSWFVLFLPLTFSYLIVTKRLYDIDVVMRRIAFTLIISIPPSIIITGVHSFIYQNDFSIKSVLLSFFTVTIILTFVLYSIEHMYTRLERFMFPRKHVLQAALKRISKDLTSTSSFRDLKDLILLDIVNTLQVYGGAIVFKYRDSMETIREGEIDQAAIEQLVSNDTPEEHPELMCFEINRHEEYTSYLIMTRKKSNTRLGLEEVQWLNLIISYLAVSLENVYLIRKLTDKLNRLASQLPDEQEAQDFNWFRKLTFELQERERVRIATDLHDTTMQDLFFLKRKLAAIGEKYPLPADAKESIGSLIEYVEIINVNLRQSCFDLHPYLLQEIGLVRTIEKIIERESYSCPFQIRFDAVGANAIERKDLETKRHLFRIVQELLNNAKKHSEATLVSIRLTSSNGKFWLHYRDDGVGFDPDRLTAPDVGTSGVGMEQLRSRILHLQGHLELDAGRGTGVDLRISFPMKEGMTA
jgi:two-component system sensor histidine kinase ComP